MRILVFGATGSQQFNVIGEAKKKGAEVIAATSSEKSFEKLAQAGATPVLANLADADKINNELNNPKYLTIIENYKEHNKLPDPYAAILKATLINKACLNLGYTPIGASFAMGILNSDKKIKEKGNIIEGFYKNLIK